MFSPRSRLNSYLATPSVQDLVRPLKHAADIERILVELVNTTRLYLMVDDVKEEKKARALTRHVYRCVSDLCCCFSVYDAIYFISWDVCCVSVTLASCAAP
jgi:hypothetical protein